MYQHTKSIILGPTGVYRSRHVNAAILISSLTESKTRVRLTVTCEVSLSYLTSLDESGIHRCSLNFNDSFYSTTTLRLSLFRFVRMTAIADVIGVLPSRGQHKNLSDALRYAVEISFDPQTGSRPGSPNIVTIDKTLHSDSAA